MLMWPAKSKTTRFFIAAGEWTYTRANEACLVQIVYLDFNGFLWHGISYAKFEHSSLWGKPDMMEEVS